MFSKKKIIQAIISLNDKYPERTKELALATIGLLKENKQMYLLPEIIGGLETEEDRRRKENIFNLILARPVSDEIILEIKEQFGVFNQEKLKILIDKNIIAGFIARYKNVVIDASVKNQFLKLKNSLKK